jgi:toxin CcdB
MAQWDVHANPSPQARALIPFVVVLQSDLLAELPTRLVAPLSRSTVAMPQLPKRLAPRFEIAGETLTFKPHEAGTLPSKVLGRAVASLKHEASNLINALDAVTSGV